MIIFAANLVKQYSKLKTSKKVSIIYTQIKNVIKTKTIGQVILQGIQKKISL
jgi:predicted ribosome quality control (RQC) complex YloA/Tae2 family protein